MAKVTIVYWKEIPVQIQAEDDSGQVSELLSDRFQQGVDAISMFDGSSGSDEYMEGWKWGEYVESPNTARETVASMAERFNDGFPEDFVSRIRDLHRGGRRDSRPGAIDDWKELGKN